MYKQILIIIVLLILSIGLYILTLKEKDKSKIETIKIPKIVIPKKSIRFKITKNQDNQINFRGTFVEENTSKEIMEFLNRYRVIDNTTIDKNLERDRDIIIFIKKILKRLDSSFIEWTILYKDKKLLISGKSRDIKSKDSIDNLINLSTLNCFSDIEVIQPAKDNPLEIISNLKSVIKDEEMESINSTTPTDDEVEDIILALKKLKPKKFIKGREIKKEIQKSKKRIRKKIEKKREEIKKIVTKKREKTTLRSTKIKTKKIIKREIEKKEIEIEPAKPIPISYREYKSLPDIQPIDNIEEFNKKLKSKNMKIIDRGTIYIDK